MFGFSSYAVGVSSSDGHLPKAVAKLVVFKRAAALPAALPFCSQWMRSAASTSGYLNYDRIR
ncbi:hypothetical protein EJ02DRAFT_12607 [Clathrospora elynae]|uniref:Uncharacterized protein n=1 Tax=Clathrospora elynae TaxID=706981 RepID=A0A6A5T549_9PLEO|nr:hypothetical protein EJ02DRAFT_12607 [Clathrospora elynae]